MSPLSLKEVTSGFINIAGWKIPLEMKVLIGKYLISMVPFPIVMFDYRRVEMIWNDLDLPKSDQSKPT